MLVSLGRTLLARRMQTSSLTLAVRCCMRAPIPTQRSYHATSSFYKQTALILGSSGSVGSTVSKYLSRQVNMKVLGADVVELPNESDWELDDFIPLPHFTQNPTLGELTERLAKGVNYSLHSDDSLKVIVVASGGWQMDPTASLSREHESHLQQTQDMARLYGDSMETMMRMNFYPVAAAGYIAQEFMAEEGLFVVIGATAALQPTPGMIGYGVSKSAAHYYVQTLGSMTGLAVSTKSLRKQGRMARRKHASLDSMSVVGILPTMMDTPTNREAMPNEDFDQWTKPLDIAKEIETWATTPPLRPHSGSLVKVFTDAEGTHFQLVR